MSITLTANYKETLSPKVVEVIDGLIENGYDLEDLLTIVDYFGEDYQENLEEILDVLEDTGANNSDLFDYLEEWGSDNLEYFAKYWELLDDHNEGAIEAFCHLWGPEDLEHFEDSYSGYYSTDADFAESICEGLLDHNFPSWIVIDWEATWNSSLRYDYSEHDGHYFSDF